MSDTVTKPTKGMMESIMDARLGDDVFREDPTVIELEERLASMFGKEAGLFCPSGTMCNQIAIKAHTSPLDEMICDVNSHVYQFEVAGYAFHSQIAVNPIQGNQGILTPQMIFDQIKPLKDWLPRTKLVVLENSCNRTGGNCYGLDQMEGIHRLCQSKNLKLHLDGARIFNALIARNLKPKDIGPLFDSISICLSKGLGTPAGSVLLGPKSWIDECRRIRKVMGGGMRQVGILAAAGLYALDFHVVRLAEDHQRAKRIETILKQLEYVDSVIPVETNIIIFQIRKDLDPEKFVERLHAHGIHCSAFGKQSIRFVTHLDITDDMIDQLETIMKSLVFY